jgi:hypothetical protein
MPRGQPWTPAVPRPHGRDELHARRMAVLWTFRESSLGRHVPHALLRNAVLNLPLIIPVTACRQINYVQRYSKYIDDEDYRRRILTGCDRSTPKELRCLLPRLSAVPTVPVGCWHRL